MWRLAPVAASLAVLPPFLTPDPPPPPASPPAASELSTRPGPAGRGRFIPVGLANVENQIMNSGRYVYAIRFVLDRDTRMYRFLSGFRLDGARGLSVGHGYGGGSGGRIRARLVAVDRKGRPNMRRVLARETLGAKRRLLGTANQYGVRTRNLLLYFNTRNVLLRRGRMYAMTFQNVARRPGRNYFSQESPTVRASQAGPNGRNTYRRGARGAIAGLNPREAVGWSIDGGRRWVWGRRVGAGPSHGSYGGSRRSDDGVRLPWYGWQVSPFSVPRSNQPYYAYRQRGSFTLVARNAPRGTILREAGGYAPRGRSVGVVTVQNLRTGAVGRTGRLGGGIARGPLYPEVGVAPGDSYSVSNSGTVYKAEGDVFLRNTFRLGELVGGFPFTTLDHDFDRAELFALPHPFYGTG